MKTWSERDKATATRLYLGGVSPKEIGKQLRPKRSAGAVKFWLHANKITRTPKTPQRRCLSCQKMFDSTGPGNRICTSCKSSPVYAAAC